MGVGMDGCMHACKDRWMDELIDRWDWMILCKAAKCIWVYIHIVIFCRQTSFQIDEFSI